MTSRGFVIASVVCAIGSLFAGCSDDETDGVAPTTVTTITTHTSGTDTRIPVHVFGGVHCCVERLAQELGDLFGCCQPLVRGVETRRGDALHRLGLVWATLGWRPAGDSWISRRQQRWA